MLYSASVVVDDYHKTARGFAVGTLPRTNDVMAAEAAYSQFLASPPSPFSMAIAGQHWHAVIHRLYQWSVLWVAQAIAVDQRRIL